MSQDDSSLGGYFQVHQRPPAFEGSDGRAYSVALYIDEQADAAGQFGGAFLFIRWSPSGDAPDGHLETDYLTRAATREAVTDWLQARTLHEVKEALDRAIGISAKLPVW